MTKIINVLNGLNIKNEDYEFYGPDIVKIDYSKYQNIKNKGKLILLTSINPKPSGEGKTTTAIGLTDGLNLIGKKAILALREPSLGPVFGAKGTATGGGESEVFPVDKINLHFTGDIHAITAANNLISSVIDNEIYWGNKKNIDLNRIVWQRCLDLNDRALRKVELEIKKNIKRKESFNITAASNMMTILCLSKNTYDLQERLENTIVAYDIHGKELLIKDFEVVGSVMVLIQNVIKPNLVLTKYNSPSLIHLGPFANIAIGTNSMISTNLALKLGDYAIVESGFGSDLGFEKFMNVINFDNDLIPDCVIMVVTIASLRMHDDFTNNFIHLEQHLKHIELYNLNLIVALNVMKGDTKEEFDLITNWLNKNNYIWEQNEAYEKGPEGAKKLANRVVEVTKNKKQVKWLINNNDTIEQKIQKIAKNFYYLDEVTFSDNSIKKIKELAKSKYSNLPICMVKEHSKIDGNTQNIKNYKLNIRNMELNSGGRFILAYTNSVFSMPGLGKDANYKYINLINNKVKGLK
ncbi:formate--tetrahydrofolate ligase [Spiroplasma tabanidicola]|uniref:Formate--tetrahydrofolate ligase n=1 Tax=Spiroplasma tabanidicola TaxID=324079 RepID=A0A6I6C852_9MOLU|nr:formate--tetrahydrofolate ligase [Spiroplasma tabanidicola]QGS51609.1 formate--tetrahydrofolate ligase [Spiroplasma tabanidicola]